MMTGNEIREKFLEFFEKKGHRRVRSSSLVPHGDATLLFTNAGMNQFKDVFLGLEKREYVRATTAQKCVRAGGKHNDLENVGFTKRHHTFFEMMGNFSFGPLGTVGQTTPYFKSLAIEYAWELLTSTEWFAIPKDKLYVTVFGGAEVAPGTVLGVDEEARGFWLEQKVAAERIVPILGLKDNFWAMGDTGPCGPCSEIFYDMGVAASEERHAGCKFPCDCGRYVEIWNLVFMQFNRVSIPYPDDVTAVGPRFAVVPLPKPSIDTGMGLERVAAVLQHVISNYETDLFKPLIRQARALINENRQFQDSEQNQASLRIIADHARATTFLISDGVVPSNEGRGYVLRKIMRRAIRHARLLGGNAYVLTNMTRNVADQMSQEYKEPKENIDFIQRVVRAEEERYVRVVEVGFRRLFEQLRPMIKEKQQVEEGKHEIVRYFSELRHNHREPGQALSADVSRLSPIVNKHFVPHTWLLQQAKAWSVSIPDNLENYPEKEWRLDGDKAFRSYDTDGLSRDFIAEVSHDASIPVDWAGFEEEMHLQRMRARASWKGGAGKEANPAFAKIAETHKTEKDFYSHGTESTKDKDARIVAIVLTGSAGRADTKAGPVSELKASESGEVVLDRTVIYAESGGQVADTGAFYDASESQVLAEVTGAYYPVAGLVAHRVKAKETLRVGDRVTVVADAERRARIIRNHSGTHLVHAALRNTLGTHVKQAGSLNAPERLRFDFSHFAPVDAEELRDIEQQVNDEIRWNTPVETKVTTIDDALASGALAFFGDKYPESNVRVVTIPDERAPRGFYSKELCGGVHVHRIGDVGVLKIVGEQSVAAGVRRIEAVTGIAALEHFQQQAAVLSQVASQLNVAEDSVLATVEKMSATVKALEKELEGQKRKGALGQLDDLVGRMQVVKGVKVVAAEVGSVDREGLRQLVDSLRQKLGSGVVALGMPDEDKVALIVGVTKDLTAKVHAGKLIKALAEQVGGSGGGRPDLAEAGGKDTSALKSALGSVPGLLEALL